MSLRDQLSRLLRTHSTLDLNHPNFGNIVAPLFGAIVFNLDRISRSNRPEKYVMGGTNYIGKNEEDRMVFFKELAKVLNNGKEPDTWSITTTTMYPKRWVSDGGRERKIPREYLEDERIKQKTVITWVTGETLNQFILTPWDDNSQFITYRKVPPDPNASSDADTDDEFMSSRCSPVDVLQGLHDRLSALELRAMSSADPVNPQRLSSSPSACPPASRRSAGRPPRPPWSTCSGTRRT